MYELSRKPRDLGFWTTNTSSSSVAAKPSPEMAPICALFVQQDMSIHINVFVMFKDFGTLEITENILEITERNPCLASCQLVQHGSAKNETLKDVERPLFFGF